ncbi:Oidioi.mRNA.OKI2018_I69.YSR.g17183.t1.cds [Oikopleura dioica]|uniref:Oidioi.mRNA.OKI2018_I69.YSR.g17183.t1.cds n=1 Tax=Oikopleura dioica TaxID=34765 RepID=A0ABN7SQN2_OIKDI|nr:Oidioi.mRNA.OKI2018_I69.YSR.g17183.t1.cds [Oikopleura dioica]
MAEIIEEYGLDPHRFKRVGNMDKRVKKDFFKLPRPREMVDTSRIVELISKIDPTVLDRIETITVNENQMTEVARLSHLVEEVEKMFENSQNMQHTMTMKMNQYNALINEMEERRSSDEERYQNTRKSMEAENKKRTQELERQLKEFKERGKQLQGQLDHFIHEEKPRLQAQVLDLSSQVDRLKEKQSEQDNLIREQECAYTDLTDELDMARKNLVEKTRECEKISKKNVNLVQKSVELEKKNIELTIKVKTERDRSRLANTSIKQNSSAIAGTETPMPTMGNGNDDDDDRLPGREKGTNHHGAASPYLGNQPDSVADKDYDGADNREYYLSKNQQVPRSPEDVKEPDRQHDIAYHFVRNLRDANVAQQLRLQRHLVPFANLGTVAHSIASNLGQSTTTIASVGQVAATPWGNQQQDTERLVETIVAAISKLNGYNYNERTGGLKKDVSSGTREVTAETGTVTTEGKIEAQAEGETNGTTSTVNEAIAEEERKNGDTPRITATTGIVRRRESEEVALHTQGEKVALLPRTDPSVERTGNEITRCHAETLRNEPVITKVKCLLDSGAAPALLDANHPLAEHATCHQGLQSFKSYDGICKSEPKRTLAATLKTPIDNRKIGEVDLMITEIKNKFDMILNFEFLTNFFTGYSESHAILIRKDNTAETYHLKLLGNIIKTPKIRLQPFETRTIATTNQSLDSGFCDKDGDEAWMPRSNLSPQGDTATSVPAREHWAFDTSRNVSAHNISFVQTRNMANDIPVISRGNQIDIVNNSPSFLDLAEDAVPIQSVLPIKVDENSQPEFTNPPHMRKYQNLPKLPDSAFNINQALRPQDKAKLLSLLHEYGHVFSRNRNDLGPGARTPFSYKIDYTVEQPQLRKIIPIPERYKDDLRKHIKVLEEQGVVARADMEMVVTTSWVAVPKKNNTIRWCLDCRPQNSVTLQTNFPLPPLTQILAKMSNNKFFSSYDLTSAFHQFCLNPSNFRYYTFWTRTTMFSTIGELPLEAERLLYLYRVCSPTSSCRNKNFEEHLEDVRQLLHRLSECNIVLNVEKCTFATRTINLFGYTLSEKGYTPEKGRISKIRELATPKTKKELKSSVAALAYYRASVERFAEFAAPLFDLLKESAKFDESEVERPWRRLLRAVEEAHTLTCPDLNLKFILRTDSSKRSYGSILSQIRGDKEEIIRITSNQWTSTQLCWAISCKELISTAAGVRANEELLRGKFFHIETDNQANLHTLQSRKRIYLDRTGPVARAILYLALFDFSVEWLKGTEERFLLTDLLSRKVITKDSEIRIAQKTKEPLLSVRTLTDKWIPLDSQQAEEIDFQYGSSPLAASITQAVWSKLGNTKKVGIDAKPATIYYDQEEPVTTIRRRIHQICAVKTAPAVTRPNFATIISEVKHRQKDDPAIRSKVRSVLAGRQKKSGYEAKLEPPSTTYVLRRHGKLCVPEEMVPEIMQKLHSHRSNRLELQILQSMDLYWEGMATSVSDWALASMGVSCREMVETSNMHFKKDACPLLSVISYGVDVNNNPKKVYNHLLSEIRVAKDIQFSLAGIKVALENAVAAVGP